MSLNEIQYKIDVIDGQIFSLFEQRMQLSAEEIKIKIDEDLNIENKSREEELLVWVKNMSENHGVYVQTLFSSLLDVTHDLQKKISDEYKK